MIVANSNPGSRVPIITFVHKPTRISIDLSNSKAAQDGDVHNLLVSATRQCAARSQTCPAQLIGRCLG